ncbi:MAG: protease SohB [Gammaproteobacteria bacterium]|jgi:serine protease SohB|nr:protease SohB [Gammaproteobacteria bacterium]
MAEFFLEYGLFLAKTVTLVMAIIAIVLVVVAVASRRQPQGKDSIEIKKLNQKYDDVAMAVNSSILPKDAVKKLSKEEKQKQKQIRKQKTPDEDRKRIFVLTFHGDIRASAVASLREEITAILMVANEKDEVFVRLDSGGGIVNAYGLAASQLMRVRERNIPLTVSVDKVAASGGYMMACVANKIIAAPFSIVGSIGVVAQIPNFHRLLKKHDIDFEQFTAGEFKRTVTMFGENTEEGRVKFRKEVEDIHLLFKDFISEHRPKVDIASVSTGEHWPGIRALENQLVDELKTSDDYLLENSKSADLFEIKYTTKKSVMEKLGFQMQQLVDKWQFG